MGIGNSKYAEIQEEVECDSEFKKNLEEDKKKVDNDPIYEQINLRTPVMKMFDPKDI
jgi:hypothetical protein